MQGYILKDISIYAIYKIVYTQSIKLKKYKNTKLNEKIAIIYERIFKHDYKKRSETIDESWTGILSQYEFMSID